MTWPAEYQGSSQRALIDRDKRPCGWRATRPRLAYRWCITPVTVPCCSRGEADRSEEEVANASGRFAANVLLQWTIMRWAAEQGFATYDMSGVDNHSAPGLPRDESHPLWNLFRFKAQWGARPIQFVGAWEHAPWPMLGQAFRRARSFGERPGA